MNELLLASGAFKLGMTVIGGLTCTLLIGQIIGAVVVQGVFRRHLLMCEQVFKKTMCGADFELWKRANVNYLRSAKKLQKLVQIERV